VKDDTMARKSLFSLIADLPRLVIGQVKNEIEQFKAELVAKIKHAGIGVGLFAAAGFIAFFLLAVLVAAAILGLATVMPGWLAALVVAGVLLVIVVILVLAGLHQVKQGIPPAPTETIKSVKKDVNVIKGLGTKEIR